MITIKNELFSTIHKGIGIRVLASILLMTCLVYLSSTKFLVTQFREMTLLPSDYHIEFLIEALHTDAVISCIPVLSALPFSANYIDEVKSKYSRFCVIRVGYHNYIFSQTIICFLLGGGVVFAGILLSFGISNVLLLPMQQASAGSPASFPILKQTTFLMIMNGGMWAVLGMAMSTLMESKYIAYTSPFVIFYLLVIIYERYFPYAYLIYPPNWTNPVIWPYGTWSAAVFLLEVTLIFGILFVIRAERRLREL